MNPDLIYQIGLGLLAAGAVYGGIRTDLRWQREKSEAAAQSARRAHERIDEHVNHHLIRGQ